jgi:hypothetical protein
VVSALLILRPEFSSSETKQQTGNGTKSQATRLLRNEKGRNETTSEGETRKKKESDSSATPSDNQERIQREIGRRKGACLLKKSDEEEKKEGFKKETHNELRH